MDRVYMENVFSDVEEHITEIIECIQSLYRNVCKLKSDGEAETIRAGKLRHDLKWKNEAMKSELVR